ncbi:uncharacterized protein N7482_010551 [Penicillium canariense]|uniref:Rhodopsin domain-containing protein n=1 Tax=Penicillium canariense TaxID=189055 RepID=A0A9W9LE62_9EURO|nr:uncharacterized protein N7482_010551 [Penicillium canariense]KAJ5151299.1 hypothetical protein N7482_010551 [Penicillium canariense]
MKQFGDAIIIVDVVFWFLATVFVALRLVSRTVIVRKVNLSDTVMLVGWVLTTALSGVNIFATTKGLGLREGVLLAWRRPLAVAEYVFAVLYYPALGAIKSSILLFYLTLAAQQRLFRLGVLITLVVVILFTVALTLVNLFPCRPLSSSLLIQTPPGTYCIDIVALYISTAPINIVTDVAIFVLPLPMLWRVHLPRRQRIILLLTFGTGLFVIVISILRTEFLLQTAISRVTKPHKPSVHDLSYYDGYVLLWSTVELNLSIMCGCVPSLRPLFSRFLPRIVHSPVRTQRSTDPGTSTSDGQHGLHSLSGDSVRKFGRMKRKGTNPQDSMTRPASGSNPAARTERRPRFDFFRLSRSKNMLNMGERESRTPLAVMGILFLLWGFADGIINIFFWRFQRYSNSEVNAAFGMHAAYWGAYLFGPLLISRPVLKSRGFKICLLTGISIFWLGMLLFWTGTVLISVAALVVASFVSGLGLSVLSTAAHLFIVLCGPPNLGEIRLTLARCIYATSGAAALILSQQVLFEDVADASGLIEIQWIFLVMALVSMVLVAMYSFLQLPEAADEELKELTRWDDPENCGFVCGARVVWVTLVLGALSQFCTVGGQESFRTNFLYFVPFNEPDSHPSKYTFVAIGRGAVAAGYLLTALMLLVCKPRWVLLSLAGIFSINFAICLRGMGEHTKTAAAFLTTACISAAPFPFVQRIVSESHGYRYGSAIDVALFSTGAFFSLYLNLVGPARMQIDGSTPQPEIHQENPPSITYA